MDELRLDLKRRIKLWEKAFINEHGRAPGRDDAKNDPTIAATIAKFKSLNKQQASGTSQDTHKARGCRPGTSQLVENENRRADSNHPAESQNRARPAAPSHSLLQPDINKGNVNKESMAIHNMDAKGNPNKGLKGHVHGSNNDGSNRHHNNSNNNEEEANEKPPRVLPTAKRSLQGGLFPPSQDAPTRGNASCPFVVDPMNPPLGKLGSDNRMKGQSVAHNALASMGAGSARLAQPDSTSPPSQLQSPRAQQPSPLTQCPSPTSSDATHVSATPPRPERPGGAAREWGSRDPGAAFGAGVMLGDPHTSRTSPRPHDALHSHAFAPAGLGGTRHAAGVVPRDLGMSRVASEGGGFGSAHAWYDGDAAGGHEAGGAGRHATGTRHDGVHAPANGNAPAVGPQSVSMLMRACMGGVDRMGMGTGTGMGMRTGTHATHEAVWGADVPDLPRQVAAAGTARDCNYFAFGSNKAAAPLEEEEEDCAGASGGQCDARNSMREGGGPTCAGAGGNRGKGASGGGRSGRARGGRDPGAKDAGSSLARILDEASRVGSALPAGTQLTSAPSLAAALVKEGVRGVLAAGAGARAATKQSQAFQVGSGGVFNLGSGDAFPPIWGNLDRAGQGYARDLLNSGLDSNEVAGDGLIGEGLASLGASQELGGAEEGAGDEPPLDACRPLFRAGHFVSSSQPVGSQVFRSLRQRGDAAPPQPRGGAAPPSHAIAPPNAGESPPQLAGESSSPAQLTSGRGGGSSASSHSVEPSQQREDPSDQREQGGDGSMQREERGRGVEGVEDAMRARGAGGASVREPPRLVGDGAGHGLVTGRSARLVSVCEPGYRHGPATLDIPSASRPVAFDTPSCQRPCTGDARVSIPDHRAGARMGWSKGQDVRVRQHKDPLGLRGTGQGTGLGGRDNGLGGQDQDANVQEGDGRARPANHGGEGVPVASRGPSLVPGARLDSKRKSTAAPRGEAARGRKRPATTGSRHASAGPEGQGGEVAAQGDEGSRECQETEQGRRGVGRRGGRPAHTAAEVASGQDELVADDRARLADAGRAVAANEAAATMVDPEGRHNTLVNESQEMGAGVAAAAAKRIGKARAIEELTVAELRQRLRAAGLSVTGAKSALVERLKGGHEMMTSDGKGMTSPLGGSAGGGAAPDLQGPRVLRNRGVAGGSSHGDNLRGVAGHPRAVGDDDQGMARHGGGGVVEKESGRLPVRHARVTRSVASVPRGDAGAGAGTRACARGGGYSDRANKGDRYGAENGDNDGRGGGASENGGCEDIEGERRWTALDVEGQGHGGFGSGTDGSESEYGRGSDEEGEDGSISQGSTEDGSSDEEGGASGDDSSDDWDEANSSSQGEDDGSDEDFDAGDAARRGGRGGSGKERGTHAPAGGRRGRALGAAPRGSTGAAAARQPANGKRSYRGRDGAADGDDNDDEVVGHEDAGEHDGEGDEGPAVPRAVRGKGKGKAVAGASARRSKLRKVGSGPVTNGSAPASDEAGHGEGQDLGAMPSGLAKPPPSRSQPRKRGAHGWGGGGGGGGRAGASRSKAVAGPPPRQNFVKLNLKRKYVDRGGTNTGKVGGFRRGGKPGYGRPFRKYWHRDKGFGAGMDRAGWEKKQVIWEELERPSGENPPPGVGPYVGPQDDASDGDEDLPGSAAPQQRGGVASANMPPGRRPMSITEARWAASGDGSGFKMVAKHTAGPPWSEADAAELAGLCDQARDAPSEETLLPVLRKLFGFPSLRQGQLDIMQRVLAGQSTMAILPTGGGKSLCYQLPAAILPGVTLVVSPLLSLMEDQLQHLPPGLPGASITSAQTPAEMADVMDRLAAGKLKVLLVSPERLLSQRFLSALHRLPRISLAVVDEAHCVAEWSHNFRPVYFRLGEVLAHSLQVRCVLALTATATVGVQHSVAEGLCIPEDGIICPGDMARRNLKLSVEDCTGMGNERRFSKLLSLMKSPQYSCHPVIIYTSYKHQADDVASKLTQCGILAMAYHAGLDSKQRARVQDVFFRNRLRVVVATVAFGMGLDKLDIGGVIHYCLPRSIESYVQEIGRAGRDGREAHCTILLDDGDFLRMRAQTHSDGQDKATVLRFLQRVYSKQHRWEAGISLAGNNSHPAHQAPGNKGQQGGGPPVLCGAIRVDTATRDLDMKEEVMATILAYLEVGDAQGPLVRMLPRMHINCKLGFYGDPSALAAKNGIIASALKIARVHAGVYSFDVTRVCADAGVTLATFQDQMQALMAGKQVYYELQDWAICFSIEGEPDDLGQVASLLHERMMALEKSLLGKLSAMYHAARNAVAASLQGDAEQQSLSLHASIATYFRATGTGEEIPTPSIVTDKSELLRADIKAFLHHCAADRTLKKLTGRAVARILQGLDSPAFPSKLWRKNPFWERHINCDFHAVREMAHEELMSRLAAAK
eukprot:jgi/Mesvir1/3203/Mv16353-RA.1